MKKYLKLDAIECIALAIVIYMFTTSCTPTKNRKIVWQNAVITKGSIRLLPDYKDTVLKVGDTIKILRKIKG